MAVTRRTFLAGAVAAPVLTAGGVRRHGRAARRPLPAADHGSGRPGRRMGPHLASGGGSSSRPAARNVEVFNVPGAGGTIGLAQLAGETDNALLMMMGLVMVGAVETNESRGPLSDSPRSPGSPARPRSSWCRGDSQYNTLAGLRRRPGRPTPRARRSRAARPAAPTRSWPACWPRPPGSTRSRSTTSPTPAAASRWPRCWAARWRPASPASASTASRCRPATSKGLAVSSEQRSGQVPDVPTLTEAGSTWCCPTGAG